MLQTKEDRGTAGGSSEKGREFDQSTEAPPL